MRLFFEDPIGQRLALDTNREEWAATYETDDTIIDDDHFIIKVEAPEVLHRIEREADFCGYGYNKDIAEPQTTPAPSVYAEYLTLLSNFILKAESAGTSESGPTVPELQQERNYLAERIDKAKAAGYFDETEAGALDLILRDADNVIKLYDNAEQAYKDAAEQEPAPF